MTVLTIVLYGPALFLARGAGQEVVAINFVADTLLFAGSMLVIASVIGDGQRRSQTALGGSKEAIDRMPLSELAGRR
jgi:hypothetical protein